MITRRRLIAIVCLVVMVFTAVTPAGSHCLCGVLVPLDPLFGGVVSIPVQQVDDVDLGTAAFCSVRTPRAPPVA